MNALLIDQNAISLLTQIILLLLFTLYLHSLPNKTHSTWLILSATSLVTIGLSSPSICLLSFAPMKDACVRS